MQLVWKSAIRGCALELVQLFIKRAMTRDNHASSYIDVVVPPCATPVCYCTGPRLFLRVCIPRLNKVSCLQRFCKDVIDNSNGFYRTFVDSEAGGLKFSASR